MKQSVDVSKFNLPLNQLAVIEGESSTINLNDNQAEGHVEKVMSERELLL